MASHCSPHGEHFPFPGPADQIRKPQYLCDFRDAARQLYKLQEDRNVFSVTNPEAAYRHAYDLTIFSIAMTEAAELQGLKGFGDLFPTMKLPFKGIVASEVEREYTDAAAVWESILEGQSHSVSRTTRARADIAKIIYRFKRGDQSNSEANYRTNLWDKLAYAFFIGENTRYQSEFKLQSLSKNYKPYKTDFIICFEDREAGNEKSIKVALLLAEVSKYPLDSALSHKDESKLAIAMSAALLESISQCGHLGKPFVEKLHIYGLLIGASDFEVVVMYPDFGLVEAGNGPEAPFRTLAFIYRSSRKHWRFSLFGSSTTETNSEEAAAFNCDSVSADKYDIVPATRTVPHKSSQAERVFDVLSEHKEHCLAIEEIDERRTKKKDSEGWVVDEDHLGDIDDEIHGDIFDDGYNALMRDIKKRFEEVDAQDYLWLKDVPVNWTGVGVLERLGDAIKAEGDRIAAGLCGNRPDKNDCYYYPKKFAVLMPKEEIVDTDTDTDTDLETNTYRDMDTDTDADTDESRYRPVVCRWKDENDMRWIDIKKRSTKYELTVYLQQAIKDSPYFPKLRSGNVDAGGRLRLTLEAVLPPKRYFSLFHERWSSPMQKRLSFSRCFLDILGALRTLHATGYVHADISPNNIGYNRRTGVWQLYDFDRAMPIEESLKTPRSAGTFGYRSSYSIVTRIFRVVDDYLALKNTCYRGFPTSMCGLSGSVISPFGRLFMMLSDDTMDLDKFYLEAFSIFCSLSSQIDPDNWQLDPSYVAALPIQKAIAEKLL